jgi:hypothetical protein
MACWSLGVSCIWTRGEGGGEVEGFGGKVCMI